MQRQRNRWRVDAGTRATRLIDRITTSIWKLDDEDLLDLHDLIRSDASSPLEEMASTEMRARKLTLEGHD